MSLKIRRLNAQDLSACLEIWLELVGGYGLPIGGSWDEPKIAAEMSHHNAIGAFDGQGIMRGFGLYRDLSGDIEIMLLATRLGDQRSGVMRVLVHSVIAGLGPRGRIWLEVHEGNSPAIYFYQTLGFQLCGERSGYYGDGGKALLFEYKVD